MNLRLQRRVVSLVLALLVAACYIPGISRVKFHGDEASWIHSSDVFEAYFGLRFRSPVFEESFWTLTQPPLGRYIIGMGRRVGGYKWADLNKPWNWTLDAASNAARGSMPSDGLLWWARLPMPFLAVLAIMIGFALVRAAAGQLAGIIFALLACFSQYFLLHLRRSMSEAPLLVCIALGMFVCYRVLRLLQTQPLPVRKVFAWLALVGVAAGAASSAKLNGVFIGLAGGALAILLAIKLNRPTRQKLLHGLLAASIVAVFTMAAFEALYPYFWPDPLKRTQRIWSQRLDSMQGQQKLYPLVSIDNLEERLRVVPYRVFESYASLAFKRAFLLNALLFVAGLSLMLVNSWKALTRGALSPAPTALILTTLTVATPPLLTPLDWPRYYLLPVFFTTLLIAIGLGALIGALLNATQAIAYRFGR